MSNIKWTQTEDVVPKTGNVDIPGSHNSNVDIAAISDLLVLLTSQETRLPKLPLSLGYSGRLIFSGAEDMGMTTGLVFFMGIPWVFMGILWG